MKEIVLFVLMLCFLALLSTSCKRPEIEKNEAQENKLDYEDLTENTGENDVNDDAEINEEINEDESELTKEYTNEKYGFTVYMPDDWEIVEFDGGAKIIPGSEEDEILAYGSIYDKETSNPYKNGDGEGFTKREVTIGNSEKATIIEGEENGKYIYEVVIIKNDIEYHLYANMTKSFYEANRETIDDMVSSIVISKQLLV